jgi:hypothetical protein
MVIILEQMANIWYFIVLAVHSSYSLFVNFQPHRW